MSDWSEHVTLMQGALKKLSWLLPDDKPSDAKEQAILAEQACRALVEYCKRREKQKLLEYAGDRQVLTEPVVYAHLPPWVQDER